MRHLAVFAVLNILFASASLAEEATVGAQPAATGIGAGASGSVLQSAPDAIEALPTASAAAPAAATVQPAATATGPEVSGEDPAETSTATLPEPAPPPVTKLVVVGFGGAYGQALRRAIYEPFREATAIEIAPTIATSATSLPEATTGWDVADVSLPVAQAACESGAIADLADLRLSAGAFGTPADQDFLDGTLARCAVGSLAWSSLVVMDPKAFRKGMPETLADVFDAKRFKQKRAFARSPRYLLEMALLADGVAPVRVYGELSTRAGVARAFKKLGQIRKHIVWSDKPEATLQMLSRGEAAMTTAFSGRAFYALASELKPYKLMWDGQVYDLSLWVVSSRSEAKEKAKEFVAFATRADRLAAVARWFPYGPVRLSALDLVDTHQTLGIDLNPFLPTNPANMTNALRFNELFWRRHEPALKASLEAWIEGKDPLPEKTPDAGIAARGG